MKKIFSIVVIFFLPFAFSSLPFGKGWGWASAQSIDSVEYFFDTDPGVGNGNLYSVNISDTITDSVSINFPGLAPGFHTLNFRIRDTNGTWSLYEGKTFFLNDTNFAQQASFDSSTAEYFYDSDPGIGNGTALQLTPGDSILDSVFAATTGLTPGFHNLYVRVKDSNNVWSLYEGGKIYLHDTLIVAAPSAPHPIAAAEYFFDTDPGIGNAIAVNAFTPADSVLVLDTLPTTPLTAGTHYLYVRVRDTMNVWSLYDGGAFVICNFIPIPDFSADTVCVNTPTTFTDLSTNVDTSFNYTYAWDFNNDSITDDITKGNTTHTYFTNGTHTVTLIINNTNGCIDTVTKTVYVDSLPSATFSLPIDTICKDDTLALSGGSPAGGIYSGSGVYGGAFFADSVSGGNHIIIYTYYNSDSCSTNVTDTLYISFCTGIQEYDLTGVSVSITPNPFQTTALLTVQSSNNEFRNLQFVLFDVFGKEIKKLNLESQYLELERGNIPAGIYLYKVIGKDANYVSGKLVVTD